MIEQFGYFLNEVACHYSKGEFSYDFDPVMVGTGGNIVAALDWYNKNVK